LAKSLNIGFDCPDTSQSGAITRITTRRSQYAFMGALLWERISSHLDKRNLGDRLLASNKKSYLGVTHRLEGSSKTRLYKASITIYRDKLT
jgi:hypothetical protein